MTLVGGLPHASKFTDEQQTHIFPLACCFFRISPGRQTNVAFNEGGVRLHTPRGPNTRVQPRRRTMAGEIRGWRRRTVQPRRGTGRSPLVETPIYTLVPRTQVQRVLHFKVLMTPEH